MTNPYRAMCAELVAEIEKWQQADDEFSDAGTIRADANYDLAPRARALLAQPVAQEEDCPGCEGTPVASNSPCAVCGRAAKLEGAQ